MATIITNPQANTLRAALVVAEKAFLQAAQDVVDAANQEPDLDVGIKAGLSNMRASAKNIFRSFHGLGELGANSLGVQLESVGPGKDEN